MHLFKKRKCLICMELKFTFYNFVLSEIYKHNIMAVNLFIIIVSIVIIFVCLLLINLYEFTLLFQTKKEDLVNIPSHKTRKYFV